MVLRALQRRVEESLSDRPVVLLIGARQSGKSTLAGHLKEKGFIDQAVSFDDLGALSAARTDPVGFVGGLGQRVFIDEIQRVPELLLPIKATVDRDRRPGRFLLTGSANVLNLPRVADSLAGRMDVLSLHPFSQGEIEGSADGFVDLAFSLEPPPARSDAGTPDLIERMLRGGFPEIVTSIHPDRRSAWWDSYILAILQRDLRELSNVVDLNDLPRLLSLLAARTASLLNHAELSRASGIPATTLRRYLALLEATFLVSEVPAWHANLGKRLVKATKVHLLDTALAAHLQGINRERLMQHRDLLGPLLETFVTHEVEKQITWSTCKPKLFHFRSHSGEEVDLILEDKAGRMVGIEVKATSTVTADMFKSLRSLSELTRTRFVRGIVLYNGTDTIPFAPNLWAVPVSSLWTWGRTRLS